LIKLIPVEVGGYKDEADGKRGSLPAQNQTAHQPKTYFIIRARTARRHLLDIKQV
jgi:hypothetical protein